MISSARLCADGKRFSLAKSSEAGIVILPTPRKCNTHRWAERDWSNSFNARAATSRVFRTRLLPSSASISLFFSEFINGHSLVVCYVPLRFRLPEIQVEDRLLTFVDNNEDVAVSISLRASYNGVSSNGQRYNLGDFIARGAVVFNVFKELSVNRVDGVRAVWKVPRVAIFEFIGRRIDLEISLW
jgi:hypothetical protein